MNTVSPASRSFFWQRYFPFLKWWPLVNRQTLGCDLFAGFIGAILVLPQGVAFAVIAGMPPEYGLYAGMVPAIIAALFGSSWHLVSGPTTAASILLYAVLSLHAQPGSMEYVQLAITLTFLVGAIELGLGFLRVGVVVDFIPHAVVVGFTAGAALLIITNQLAPFVGIPLPRGQSFLATWNTMLHHLELTNPYVLQVGMTTLMLGIVSRRLFPKVPYMMVALIGGTLFASLLIHVQGSEPLGIQRFSPLNVGLPPLSAPQWDMNVIRQLLPAALAVTILALTEAISIARSVALRTGQHIDNNQEFIGQGLSNLVGSFTSGYVATGSFNRTGINEAANAKTPIAAITGGIVLMALVPFVAPVAAYIPTAAIAGILFLVAWGLIDVHHIHRILRTSSSESLVMVVTFVATLILDMELAILLGVVLSLALYLRNIARPLLVALIPDPNSPNRSFTRCNHGNECPQLKLVRLDGSLFYGAVNHVDNELQKLAQSHGKQKHLAILASGINQIDTSGADMLANEAKKRTALGGGLYFIRLKRTPLSLLVRGGYTEEIGKNNFFRSKKEAITTILPKLEPHICRTCQARIFLECGPLGSSPARAHPTTLHPANTPTTDMASPVISHHILGGEHP